MKLRLRIALIPVLLAAACGGTRPASTAGASGRVVRISAKRFEFSPAVVHLKKGEPVELELVTEDRSHGFDAPDLGLRADIEPGKPAHLSFVPDRAGTFTFRCDVSCGSGHEDMSGEIDVEP